MIKRKPWPNKSLVSLEVLSTRDIPGGKALAGSVPGLVSVEWQKAQIDWGYLGKGSYWMHTHFTYTYSFPEICAQSSASLQAVVTATFDAQRVLYGCVLRGVVLSMAKGEQG